MTVRGEADDIRQVCYNILENAVKFSFEGGVIGVKLWKEGGRAFVQIENSGAEIPKDELPFIFDRFHKSDKSRSIDRDGVGLGLFIVKSIINAYRETINVTSENGKTVFTFTMTVA
jgi:signal transduction histidine kinase